MGSMDGSYVNVVEPSMERSQFSTAVFHNVADSYPLVSELPCEFSVTESLKDLADNNCWIGLFRVGWETVEDCACRHVLSPCDEELKLSNTNQTMRVLLPLQASGLSTEDDEFYQFCFVGKSDEILGASCPFQLKSVESTKNESTSEISWWLNYDSRNSVEEEVMDDAVLVHNKTTFLEDLITKLTEENAVLKANEIGKEEKLKEMEEVVQVLEQHNQDVTKQLAEKEHCEVVIRDNLETAICEAKTEKQYRITAEGGLCIKDRELADLQQSMTVCEQLAADLSERLSNEDDQRLRLINSYEDKISNLEGAITQLKSTVDNSSCSEVLLKEQFESEVASFAKMYDKLQIECHAKQELLAGVLSEKEGLIFSLSSCQKELQATKEGFSNEVTALQRKLEEQLSKSHSEQKALQSELSNMKKEVESRCQEIKSLQTQNGSNHALRIACSHMQKQISQLKQQRGSASETSSNADLDGENPYVKEIDELKLRLCMGANAYRAKSVECNKLKELIEELSLPKMASSVQTDVTNLAPVVTKMDAETQNNSSVASEPEEAAKARCQQLESELQRGKATHDNVVSILLIEIQKLADRVESLKKQSCSQCGCVTAKDVDDGAARLQGNDTRKTERSTRPKLKDLAEKAPRVIESVYYEPSTTASSNAPSSPPHNAHYTLPSNVAVAPTGKKMPHAQSTGSAGDTVRFPITKSIRRYGSDPVVFCPVCNMFFPQSFTDKAATEHVNSHFM